eukprot:862565-Alexandrium_andersonii.AAC.1
MAGPQPGRDGRGWISAGLAVLAGSLQVRRGAVSSPLWSPPGHGPGLGHAGPRPCRLRRGGCGGISAEASG